MFKYPRTLHLTGSRIQAGDDLKVASFDEIKGRFLVIEEKVDGANCGISFNGGRLILQSRGHELSGGDHPQFDLLKAWGAAKRDDLYSALGDQYTMFGEWLYAKHAAFYDALPHYFLEFDIYDKELCCFLGTQDRHELLDGLPVVSVPVLARGEFDPQEILALIGASKFKTVHVMERLTQAAEQANLDVAQVMGQTDVSLLMEGIYIKDETSGRVDARYKFVREDFRQQVDESDEHWTRRRILPNCLNTGVDIFR